MVNGKVTKKAKVRPPRKTTEHNILLDNERAGGNTAPYALEMRRLAVRTREEFQRHPAIIELRQNRQHPSDRTIRRYVQRIEEYGHLQHFRHTGNKRAEVLRGQDLLLLVIYNRKFPTADGHAKQAFLWNAWGRFQNPPRFYCLSQISRAEQRVGLSRKKTSTTAFQAFRPHVIQRRIAFWTQPYPLGINDTPRSLLIDLDEARIILDQANRGYAKCFAGYRAREAGHYKGEGRLILCAISGGEDGLRWCHCHDRAETTLEVYLEFLQEILDGLPAQPQRTFTMDNLGIHHDALVAQLIHAAGHRLVFRAPYWPKDGPIECFFSALEGNLRSKFRVIQDVYDLEREIGEYVDSRTDFVNFFQHVGFL